MKTYLFLVVAIATLSSCKQDQRESPSLSHNSSTEPETVFKYRDTMPQPGSVITDFSDFADSVYSYYRQEVNRAGQTVLLTHKASVIFKRCLFLSDTFKFSEARGAIFRGPVLFATSYFKSSSPTQFITLQFTSFDSVAFVNNIYDTAMAFYADTFRSNLHIFNQFGPGKSPYFLDCRFYGLADLKGSTFRNDLVFQRCSLGEKLNLSNCNFEAQSRLMLLQTFLPDTIDLSDVTLSGNIDLTGAYPNKGRKCHINLLGTDISKIRMQYKYFKLYFPERLLKDKLYKDKISSSYEMLLTNFRTNGFMDSYEALDKEYMKWQARSNWILYVNYAWWQFGYEKAMILGWTIFFIVVFSIWNFIRYPRFQDTYPVPKLQWSTIGASGARPSLLRKYFLVLMYTGFIFFRISIDFNNLNFSSYKFVVYIISQYAIGLLCTGFLINWIIS